MAGFLPFFSSLLGSGFSARSLFNTNYINDVWHYSFINHVLEADNWVAPKGSGYVGVNPSWPEMLDQTTGYPNHATASGKQFGGGLKIPASSKFAGPYVITWDGDGTLALESGTWTETNNTGTTYTKNSNGNWTNIVGQTAYIIANLSGWSGPPGLIGCYINATGGAGGYVRNVRVYRQVDEADFLAGKVWRSGYKQQIIDHDPSCIRLMNWAQGNNSDGMRFENRILPTAASYGESSSFISSPLYGTTTGSMQYTLPLVTTGVRQTPATMTHGEIATCRIGTKMTGGPAYGSSPANITAITPSGANTRITTATPHGFMVGMKAFHLITAGNGKPNMDRYAAAVTNVVSTTQYDIAYDSTAGAAYTGTGGTVIAYVSLDVGARGEYPIQFDGGAAGIAYYGDDGSGTYVRVNALRTFYFDKNVIGRSDGAGTYLKGAWLLDPDGGELQGHWDGIPLEILTKLIVELNEMSPAKPISMWICFPHRAMLSIDPDYSAASNWAIKATDVILNGNTVGSVTYPGLKSGAPTANLFIEFCNEIWNIGPHQGYYIDWYSKSRWGMSASKPDGFSLRATAMARDIELAYPSEAQIKHVMGLSATGMTAGDYFANYYSWHGNSTPGGVGNYYTTDSVVVSGSWGAPKTWFDACAIAPYTDPGPAYYDGTGTGSFPDDAAMYAGTTPYSSPNQTQAITNFINQIISSPDSTVSLADYLTRQDEYIASMGTGQYVIHYEGGPNWDPTVGAHVNDPPGYTHLVTAAEATLMVAAYNSAQLGTALVNYFNSVCAKSKSAMPAVYLSVNVGQRWAFAMPDSYAASSSEGGGLSANPAWAALTTRNASVT